ncbi:hypothetical protein FB45DRAFT_873390 [Roridomyces roridus]|uniref:Uncharacterized protein n=1 Tax=Roridomyces roridus TaxID=1738132 RepID=A0AAD7BB73_9AGAR|nr:hypothetical protein FB45DRAFT_873390 [Roridomyces roridus]
MTQYFHRKRRERMGISHLYSQSVFPRAVVTKLHQRAQQVREPNTKKLGETQGRERRKRRSPGQRSVDAKSMCCGGKQEAVPINGAENGTVIGCQTDLWSRSASDSPSAEMLTTRRPLEAGRSEQEWR